jgi:hypothetical protein
METKKEEIISQSDSAANAAGQSKEIKCSNNKTRLAIITLILIVVGLFAGYVFGVIGYVKVIGPYFSKLEYQRAMEEYLKPYKEDFVGGNTPEETIDLFIDALKKEDYELAVKYFVVERQEKAKSELDGRDKIKIIEELEFAKNNWHKETGSENTVEFWYNKEGFEISRDIVIEKNMNNKWKIGSINIYYLGF